MEKNVASNADNVLVYFVEPVKFTDFHLKTFEFCMHLEKATHVYED